MILESDISIPIYYFRLRFDKPLICVKQFGYLPSFLIIYSFQDSSSEDDESEAEQEEEELINPEPYKFDHSKSLEVLNLIRQRQKAADCSLFLQITLHYAPTLPGDNQYRDVVPLAHSIYHKPRVYLIVKDGESDLDSWKPHCESVLTLSEYRKATKGALKRRKFISNFDIILADARIAQSMRTQYGKEVYRSKKVPYCVRLKSNIEENMDIVKRSTQLIFGSNRKCLEVKVGRMTMNNDLLLDNLKCLIESFDLHIPRGALNVKKLQLRSQSSKAYHLYSKCFQIRNRLIYSFVH